MNLRWVRTTVAASTVALVVAAGATATAAPIRNPANGHWYELVVLPDLPGPTPQLVDWTVANTAAKAMSFQGMRGRLVVIPSSSDNDFLTNTLILPGPTTDGIWTGGRSFSGTPGSGFFWVDGTPFGFTNWDPFDAPDDADTSNGSCSEIRPDGTWQDSFCAANDGANAFLVEFIPIASVPTNSPAGLALIALLAAVAAAVVLRRSSGPVARG